MPRGNPNGVDFSDAFRMEVPQSLREEFAEACRATSSRQPHLIREWMREYIAEHRERGSARLVRGGEEALDYPETTRDSSDPKERFELFHIRTPSRLKSEFSRVCEAIPVKHAKVVREWMREYIAENAGLSSGSESRKPARKSQ